MQTRPLVLTGAMLASLTGCHSYFPSGYGNAGPYSSFPQGTYPPPTTFPPGTQPQGTYPPRGTPPLGGPPSTYQPTRPPGQVTGESPSLKNDNKYAPAQGNNPVPPPRDPGGVPGGLGTPSDESEETIRRGTSRLDRQPGQLDTLTDESEETRETLGDEEFARPKVLQPAAAIGDGDEMPRVARKPRPNPYSRDPDYKWLRGTVVRESNGNGWRLKYSNNPLDEEDRYGGSLLIVGHEEIEYLLDNEVIAVEGEIDPVARDSRGKPAYRVRGLKLLKPKE